MLIVCCSDTLANLAEFESTARRASMEASALVAEREKWEVEKENMRHDREVWGQVPEDEVPPGARWSFIRPAYECRAYGKREYVGVLRDVPEGWSAMDACMNMPVSIEFSKHPSIEIKQPYRCAFVGSSADIRGYWIVDQHQDDCKPKLEDIHDTVSQIILYPYVLAMLTCPRGVQTLGRVSLEWRHKL